MFLEFRLDNATLSEGKDLSKDQIWHVALLDYPDQTKLVQVKKKVSTTLV